MHGHFHHAVRLGLCSRGHQARGALRTGETCTARGRCDSMQCSKDMLWEDAPLEMPRGKVPFKREPDVLDISRASGSLLTPCAVQTY